MLWADDVTGSPPQVRPAAAAAAAAPGETLRCELFPENMQTEHSIKLCFLSVSEPQVTTIKAEPNANDKTDSRPLPPRCVCVVLKDVTGQDDNAQI